ncbi:MAG: ribonuclease HII [Acidobacteria bacterium]|nr:ribonuclease HII [Acidobacteriota bacterium]
MSRLQKASVRISLPPTLRKARKLWGEDGGTKDAFLRQLICSDAPEQALRYHGYKVIAGVDEVGRGALCGPVVAAAVILPEEMSWLADKGLRDSKQLLPEEREALDAEIRSIALAFSIAEVDNETIDRVNIYQASRMAMQMAVTGLAMRPDHLLIDAMRISDPCAQTKLIYGDSLSLSIAAASVIAKVYRDALMCDLAKQYPHYGFESHKGYGTPEHRRALKEHGLIPLHRRSFAPVAAADPDAVLEMTLAGQVLFDDGFELAEI